MSIELADESGKHAAIIEEMIAENDSKPGILGNIWENARDAIRTSAYVTTVPYRLAPVIHDLARKGGPLREGSALSRILGTAVGLYLGYLQLNAYEFATNHHLGALAPLTLGLTNVIAAARMRDRRFPSPDYSDERQYHPERKSADLPTKLHSGDFSLMG